MRLQVRARIACLIVSADLAAALAGCGGAASPASPAASAGSDAPMTLASPVGGNGGTLPADYTCDGAGATVELSWSNAPIGTREFALMMTTLPGDGTTKWNWVLYGIPGSISGLVRNSSGVGTLGVGSDGPAAAYQPPCSQGPGAKVYTFTIYALSASPNLSVPPSRVTGPVLTDAIASVTLASATLSLSYARSQ